MKLLKKHNRVDEKTLIPKLLIGDQQAFRMLVAAFQEKVLNTCYGFVNSKEEAEDLTQEVFVEVFRSIEKFRGDAKLSTWIYRIAVRKSLEEIRKRKRQKRAAYFKSLIGLEGVAETVADNSKNPHQELESKQRATIMQKMLDKIPENQRIAFTLHKYEGLSYREVAEIMGLSLPAVESLMHRAKASLKKKLSVYYKNKMI